MKKFLLFLSFIPLVSLSQTAKFKEIRKKPLPEKYNVGTPTIIFPIVILNNKAAERKINDSIRNAILDEYTEVANLDSTLYQEIQGGLTDIDYEPTFNKNGLLSLHIWIVTEGAYPVTSDETLNFDLNTGNTLSLEEIFVTQKISAFKKIVSNDKIKALRNYKIKMQKLFFTVKQER